MALSGKLKVKDYVNEKKQKLCTLFACFFLISVHLFPVLGKSVT